MKSRRRAPVFLLAYSGATLRLCQSPDCGAKRLIRATQIRRTVARVQNRSPAKRRVSKEIPPLLSYFFPYGGRRRTAVIAAQCFNQRDIGAEPLGLNIQQ